MVVHSTPVSHLLIALSRLATSLFSSPDIPSATPVHSPRKFLIRSAQTCAAFRAIESERPLNKRLFTDVYAEALAGTDTMERIRARHAVKGDLLERQPRITIRTRYFDDFVQKHLQSIPQGSVQYVSLAAGMDTRSFRINLSSRVSVFELDFREVLQRKQHILGNLNPKPVINAANRTVVAADLSSEGWVSELEKNGFCTNTPTIWVGEGIVPYLEQERVKVFLKEVLDASAVGSVLGFSAILKLPRGRKFRSTIPKPRQLMEAVGWQVLQIDSLGGPQANYGRWKETGPYTSCLYVNAKKVDTYS